MLEEAKEAIFHGLILTHFETYGLFTRPKLSTPGAPVSCAILSGGGELVRVPRCDYLRYCRVYYSEILLVLFLSSMDKRYLQRGRQGGRQGSRKVERQREREIRKRFSSDDFKTHSRIL